MHLTLVRYYANFLLIHIPMILYQYLLNYSNVRTCIFGEYGRCRKTEKKDTTCRYMDIEHQIFTTYLLFTQIESKHKSSFRKEILNPRSFHHLPCLTNVEIVAAKALSLVCT